MAKTKVRKLNKKVIIPIILIIIVIIITLTYFFTTPKIELTKEKYVIEYGEKIYLDKNKLLKTKDTNITKSLSLDTSKIKNEKEKDYPNVGTYKVKIYYSIRNKKHSQDITIQVKDTTKPKFTTFTDNIQVSKNTTDMNYSTYFNASDLSKVSITVDDSKVDYNTTGEYVVTVKAIDQYKNQIDKKAKVFITDSKDTNATATTNSGDITYVKGILIVNKKYPLPKTYNPGEDKTAGDAFRTLIKDMQNQGYDISNSYSGYRSYAYQSTLYNNYVAKDGKEKADTYSARPGYSEHQTGLAFDLKHKNGTLMQNEKEADWVSNSAHKYGFIVRYQKAKEDITGYMAEPWHLRYIGDKASDIYKSGKTLEEYLGVKGGSYS